MKNQRHERIEMNEDYKWKKISNERRIWMNEEEELMKNKNGRIITNERIPRKEL